MHFLQCLFEIIKVPFQIFQPLFLLHMCMKGIGLEAEHFQQGPDVLQLADTVHKDQCTTRVGQQEVVEADILGRIWQEHHMTPTTEHQYELTCCTTTSQVTTDTFSGVLHVTLVSVSVATVPAFCVRSTTLILSRRPTRDIRLSVCACVCVCV